MGDFCNPFDPAYNPAACGTANPFSGGLPSETQQQAGPVNVYVTIPPLPIQVIVPTSIGTTIANSLTGTINSTLANVTRDILTVLQTVTGVIVANNNSALKSLGGFVQSGFDSISNALGNLSGAVGKVLQSVFSPIFSGITGVLKDIKDVLKDVVKAFKDEIDALIKAVKDNGALALLPVLQALAQSIAIISNVIKAIQLDIHAGAKALILLPTQIADSLGALDATLTRALQQIGFIQGAKVGAVITTAPGDPISTLVDNLNTGFANTAGFGLQSSAIQEFLTLATACQPIGHDWLLNKLSNLDLGSWDWVKKVLQFLLDIPIFFTQLAGLLEQQIELTREDVNKKCPIRKLDPASVIEAALRQFIDSATMRDELRVQGYDDNRVSILRKLAQQRLAPDVLLDSWYRGIIDVSVRDSALGTLGFSSDQISVLENQSRALPTINDCLRWWTFGVIDEGTFDALLKVLRLSPEQTDLLKRTYFTRETVQQMILLDGRLKAIGSGYIPESSTLPFDPLITKAATREQIGPGNVQLQWQAHWSLPSYLVIIQGYFRQLRTLDSVQKAMQAENIPQEFWDELLQLQRPLLPFRSIPGYFQAGIISEADAILELTGHGFDPRHIAWILSFASRSKKGAAAAQIASIGQLSVNTARTLFDDGVITTDQYISVLEQHKFPHDVAVLQANADELAAHTKQRKQHIIDLTDEVLAGLINVDDARSQLQREGATVAEVARFDKGIRRASASGAKHPSISEMKAFLKAHLITLDQYKAELQLQGWNDPWLAAFVQLETP